MSGLRARLSGRPATPSCTLSSAAWQVLRWPPGSCLLGMHAVTKSPETSPRHLCIGLSCSSCSMCPMTVLHAQGTIFGLPWVDEQITRASEHHTELASVQYAGLVAGLFGVGGGIVKVRNSAASCLLLSPSAQRCISRPIHTSPKAGAVLCRAPSCLRWECCLMWLQPLQPL